MEEQHPSWIEEVEKIIDTAYRECRKTLYEPEVYDILCLLGIRTPHYRTILSPEEITGDLLAEFGSSRLVLKVIASEIAHKHEAGGVKIVYKDLDFLKYSFEKMQEAFAGQGLEVHGVLLADYID